MKKYIPLILIFPTIFIFFTIGVKLKDVQAVGPLGSEVGFETLNMAVRTFIQNNIRETIQSFCYTFTKLAAVLAILTAAAFACLGLVQLIKRKSLLKVDREIIMLGVVYAVTIVLYVLFEKIAVNFRPVLEDGVLEPSYPSTHTMLVFSILGTAVFAFPRYIKGKKLLSAAKAANIAAIALTVLGRLVCGVHWLTDIIGGVFLSVSIIIFYKVAISDETANTGDTANAANTAETNKEN